MKPSSPIALEFSNKHDSAHTLQYFHKHCAGLARRPPPAACPTGATASLLLMRQVALSQ